MLLCLHVCARLDIFDRNIHTKREQMLKKERQHIILEQLNIKKRLLSSELSDQLDVSEYTIRRDLNELASEGRLLKVHGGAIATSQRLFSFQESDILDHDKKLLIAQKALSLIDDNDVLIVGGGTTNLELVNILPQDLSVTIFTYSLPVAMTLTEHKNAEVILFGGKLNKQAQIVMGVDMLNEIATIRADRCFLGISGIDAHSGVTEIDWEVSKLKKSIMDVSDRVTVITTAEKVDTKHRFLVSGAERVDNLITEVDPESQIFAPYRKKGIQIL